MEVLSRAAQRHQVLAHSLLPTSWCSVCHIWTCLANCASSDEGEKLRHDSYRPGIRPERWYTVHMAAIEIYPVHEQCLSSLMPPLRVPPWPLPWLLDTINPHTGCVAADALTKVEFCFDQVVAQTIPSRLHKSLQQQDRIRISAEAIVFW